MFGGLFDGDTTSKGNSPAVKSGSRHGEPTSPSPPVPRLNCGLAGIDNRGATCYMNALLQTLLFTPEFRDSLFALGPSELGVLADKDQPGAKVRVIPIQLQRLFGRLLLLDQQSASTEELTDSFGWRNNEEFQQHDVQELNRILFSAIEDSLVGTSGQDLISHLYHGISVNKITCEECGRVSEREEDFLDLTLAVAHYAGMQDTLQTCYVDTERMDGRNQYRCGSCDKLVDAVKSAKLRSLPPILTVSLLRFSFNYQKCERYKEIGKYTFPQEIDMSAYCEKAEPSEHTAYELYSVLIHSGSTHGGHYHAYIKDVDQLGNWTTPEKEIILLPSRLSAAEGKVDLIELNSPRELLATMLRKHGGAARRMPVDKLCQALSEETGVSWNKRFKKKFGSVTKFVKSREELFSYDARTNSVAVKQAGQNLPAAVSELSLTDKAISRSDPCLLQSATQGSGDAHNPSTLQLPRRAQDAEGGPEGRDGDEPQGATGSKRGESPADPKGDNRRAQDAEGGPEGRDGDEPQGATGSKRGESPADPKGDNRQAPTRPPAWRVEVRETPPPLEQQDAEIQQREADNGLCQSDTIPGEGRQGDWPSVQGNPEGGRSRTQKRRAKANRDCQPCEDLNSEPPGRSDTPGGSSNRARKAPDSASDSPCLDYCKDQQDDALHWFDFNDSRVLSIDEKQDLPRQFSGRESAYMLFYRRKSMTRMKKVERNSYYGMPEWLVNEIQEANKQLVNQREEYDRVANAIELTLLQSDHFEYRAGALHRQANANAQPTTLTIDRRRSVADLKTEIVKVLGDGILNGKSTKGLCLHTAKELPAGLHLYDCVSDSDSAILQEVGLASGDVLFPWDGDKIDGMPGMKTGEACRPVLVHLTYALGRDNRETAETCRGFARDLTVGEMRAIVSVATDVPLGMLKMSRVVAEAVLIRDEEDGKTVEELGIRDGDRIIAEYKKKGKAPSLAANEAKRQSRLLCLTVEDRCATVAEGSVWPVTQVEIDKDATVSELKVCIFSQLKETESSPLPSTADCRLRVNAYSTGLQPPLHESRKIADVGITSGTEVIMEPGGPPKDSEICISFAVCSSESQLNHQEAVLEKSSTVQEALEMLVCLAGVTGDQWHLRKTNWMGEPTEFLQDPDATLQQSDLAHGCLLLLEEGRLPPKGFVRLPIWLYPSPDRGAALTPNAQSEMLQWINSHLMDVLSCKSTPTPEAGDNCDAAAASLRPQHALLGNVELSQDATLADLKDQVQTLPAMLEVGLPSPGFMRLRLVEQGLLGRVLRDNRQTLRRSKVTSATHIGVQILPEEENLSSGTVVLNICQRIPETRTYTTKEELVWDMARSATPENLRQVIADRLLLASEQIAMAKHLSQKFEWLVIQDQVKESKTGKGRGKRKGGGGGGGGAKPKISLKQSPYNLKDGDTIGVKDLRFDAMNQDDFTTEEDIAGKKALEKEAEDRRKRRKELKENNAAWAFDGPRPKKPEVGLTIRVADFR